MQSRHPRSSSFATTSGCYSGGTRTRTPTRTTGTRFVSTSATMLMIAVGSCCTSSLSSSSSSVSSLVTHAYSLVPILLRATPIALYHHRVIQNSFSSITSSSSSSSSLTSVGGRNSWFIDRRAQQQQQHQPHHLTVAKAKKKQNDDTDVDASAESGTELLNGSTDNEVNGGGSSSSSSGGMLDHYTYTVGILGDLHIDPRKMKDYETGRQQWVSVLKEAKEQVGSDHVAMVSLGDLGESKNCEHNPANPSELFAGTSLCHQMAAEYLSSFDDVPYEVIGGNHDLEGIDEFRTDAANLKAFLRHHNKPTAQFVREIADKTLLVGLCSTVFRDAKYTSHEVIIDQEQIHWFEQLLTDHPAEEGYKIFVFTHAPPNGSGLRVLQENHVINGCCWLNHSDERNCRKFIELVRKHRCIKAWFSGHFHLGQDYQDSITFPTIDPKDGPYPNRGSCVFAQTSVMRSGSSRDGRQQSRLIRGNDSGFEICTVDHAKNGKVRLDASITYRDDSHNVGVYAHDDEAYAHDKYFKVYTPQFDDAGYICDVDELDQCLITDECPVEPSTVSWWKLASGHVLGLLNGMLLEYDPSTLAPLGLVVSADELIGKHIAVVDSGIEECEINFDNVGMEGADCGSTDSKEQAVIIYDENNNITVIQPNEDGSYWRKIVRNKIARMKEKRREKAAIEFAKNMLLVEDTAASKLVRSSWGPYTSTSGVAKTTTVPGLTKV